MGMQCCRTPVTHHCKVLLLDEQEIIQEINDDTIGEEVLKTVFRHLNLAETSYFGLRYIDIQNQAHWLDTAKKVASQLGKKTFTLYFGVKFYPVDPCKLHEEITRYQFFLQMKEDILQGRLPVSFNLAAELGAYHVQSELGDYDPRRHTSGYVSEFRFVSNQTVELETKIEEIHKELTGQQPSVAELNYLEKVKWLEMYGVDLHPVVGEDTTEYFLGLTPTGIIVLRNKNKVAHYYWSRINKMYHKGKYFMLRVVDKNTEENTYGFETPSKSACKHLYKCCVEHNAFFLLMQVSSDPPDIIESSTREKSYRGRLANPNFIRTPSRRYQRRMIESYHEVSKFQDNVKKNESRGSNERKSLGEAPSIPSYQTKKSESPRSTRSAPPARGLYSSPSPPRSRYSGHLRSSSPPRSLYSTGHLRSSSSRRSLSLESRSSNDSKTCRRHHSKRRTSDNESEVSKCSGKVVRRKNRSRRSYGSERERRRHRSSSKNRYELVDSTEQWNEIQRKQTEGGQIQKARVVSSRRTQNYQEYLGQVTNDGNEREPVGTGTNPRTRRHRKHRSRSRSPSEGKTRFPEELKKHFEFSLIDTDGMSESQLREIPYKVVETTAAKAIRVKLSPTNTNTSININKKKTSSSAVRRSKSYSSKEAVPPGGSPPPPYCEQTAHPISSYQNIHSHIPPSQR